MSPGGVRLAWRRRKGDKGGAPDREHCSHRHTDTPSERERPSHRELPTTIQRHLLLGHGTTRHDSQRSSRMAAATPAAAGVRLHLLQSPRPKPKPTTTTAAAADPPAATATASCPINALLTAVRGAFAEPELAGDALRAKVSTALQSADLAGCTQSGSPWARYVHYGDSTYSRNLVAFEGSFSIILNCWRPGQRTAEHDHLSAGGSVAWTKVVKGALVLTQFAPQNGRGAAPTVTSQQQLGEGMVSCAEAHELGVHRLANRTDEVAISLHVYSPPMLSCCGNPVVLCQRRQESITDKERLSMHARAPANRVLFTNFRRMVQTLHDEIEPLDEGQHHSREHIAQISELLSSMRFNQAEFSRYLNFRDDHYTRNLVGYDVPQGASRAKFTALILCWDKGQMSPIHDHAGSSCWVKVLKGQLREVRYEYRTDDDAERRGKELAVLSDRTFEPESVAYINDTQGVHAMGNPNSDSVTVTLHIYAPPYVICKMFDPDDGSVQVGSMAAAIMPSNPFTEKVAASAAAAANSHAPGSAVQSPPSKRPRLHSDAAGAAGSDQASSRPPSAGLSDSSPLNLAQLQISLKQAVRPDGTCEGAAGLLARLVLAEHEWQEFVHFEPFRYTRSLVALDSSFSLMALCWNKGHATPLHSHAPGVCSWAKVLRGALTLKRYTGTVANPALRSEHRFDEGDIVDEQQYSGLHVVGNPSTTDTTVSLHLYSPPYVDMAYVDSSGRQVSVPVVHSATSACGLATCDACGADVDAAVGVANSGSPSLSPWTSTTESNSTRLELASFGSIFSDFHCFVNFLRSELDPDDVAATTAFLEGFQFHPSEWQEYAPCVGPDASAAEEVSEAVGGVTVTLIALGENPGHRLELCSWAPGSECRANAAGRDATATTSKCGRCWLKVLQGELDEVEYMVPARATGDSDGGDSGVETAGVVVRQARLSPGAVTYFHDDNDILPQGRTAVPTRTCMLRHPTSRDSTSDSSNYAHALRLVADG